MSLKNEKHSQNEDMKNPQTRSKQKLMPMNERKEVEDMRKLPANHRQNNDKLRDF